MSVLAQNSAIGQLLGRWQKIQELETFFLKWEPHSELSDNNQFSFLRIEQVQLSNHGKNKEERNRWTGQELHHPNSSCSEVASYSSWFSKALYLERNISTRATEQEESLQVLQPLYYVLLYERYPVSATWTFVAEVQRAKDVGEKDLEGAW